ncbi:MAG: pantoate--beta-alanine ligase [Acidobacteriota bacterium]
MKTRLVETIADVRAIISKKRQQNEDIGLVPTMGKLHAGHGSLIERCRAECKFVVVSIFVNPLQFGPSEDYERYPRDLAADLSLCEAQGVDLVFAPEAGEMYPNPQFTKVEVERISRHLCGRFRPGHFGGVATVVLKLLNIVQPDRAYFGEKDAQQLAVIRRMVSDLNVPCSIIAIPTIRENDGLALSSRNDYLKAEERQAATILYQALRAAGDLIAAGERDPEVIRRQARQMLQREEKVKVEYLEIVDAEEMQPVAEIAGPVRVAVAARVGSTRLIDNVLVRKN